MENDERRLEEVKHNIKAKLEEMLAKQFAGTPAKMRVKNTTSGYNFACPYCLDSATDMHKKRGNLSIRGKYAGLYKCYNCGKSTSVSTLLRDFKCELALDDAVYVKQNITPDFGGARGAAANTVLTSQVLDKSTAEAYAIPRDTLRTSLELMEISAAATPVAYNYLVGRCQTDFSRLLYSPRYNQIVIMNLVTPDKVIGFQVRNLNPNAKAKYLTYGASRIREIFGLGGERVPDSIETLSTMFNIFNIDISRPILVTEGPFDAFLLPNAIATSGAGKSLNVSLPFWFIYDYDQTGTEHAVEKLNAGYKVFMWNKLAADYRLPKRRKWDVTDLLLHARQQRVTINIMDYFTDSIFDAMSL